MKNKLRIFLLLALCALCLWGSPAFAQTITTVTGTALDPNGIPYANAPVNITLNPVAGSVSPYVTATNTPVIMPTSVTTNSSGVFSVPLVAAASITPSGTTYNFRVCTPTVPPPLGSGASCVTLSSVTIAGASQDLTSSFNAIPPPVLINSGAPTRVATAAATAQTANISATTVYTVPANVTATYRVVCYVVLSSAGTTSTLPACNVVYTDNDTSTVETIALTATSAANTVGTVGAVATTAVPGFQAKPGTNIQYSTSGYASTGSAMAYAIHVKVELLGAP